MTILVTGGSGTFGSAYIQLALSERVDRVIALARGEHRLAALARRVADPRLECWIGDVRDRDRLRWAFRSQPDLVIHAAALKRIESCEQHPNEAAKTNIDGTRHVVEEAMLSGVPKVLVISSDKACSPATTYGHTKAAAEALALGQNAYRGRGRTQISAVRYGNILGSQGSVLDVIAAARQHGRMPVTHPDSTRFWWSIEQAALFVQSVVQRMRGAEVWVPKIPSARVVDLVSALAPSVTYDVVGMRGKEKTHEQMIASTEPAWDVGDAYVLLPHRGQWWSPQPPPDALAMPDEFTYASDQDLSTVRFEEATA